MSDVDDDDVVDSDDTESDVELDFLMAKSELTSSECSEWHMRSS